MWKMTFNKVRGIYKQWEMTSALLHTATNFKLIIIIKEIIISSSFQSQSILFWELFKWEKICNIFQIWGIVMFNKCILCKLFH